MRINNPYKLLFVMLVVIAATIPPLLSYQPWSVHTATAIPQTDQTAAVELATVSAQAPLQLVTEPDDGSQSVRAAIEHATKSIDLVMYELEDQEIEQMLVDAQNRGVNVRVLMQNVDSYGKYPNQAAYDFLQAHGVQVKWSPNYFALTHQKTLVTDNSSALIMTYNLTPQYYVTSRDFGVIDTDQNDVTAIENAFGSDWDGIQTTASNGDDLVWSPGSASMMRALINSASSTLEIYNEEMADPRVTTALEQAVARGIQVRVDMTYQTSWKQSLNDLVDAGVQVRTYAPSADRYIHAKMILVDNSKVFLGSENFSGASLDSNRELGIVLSRPGIIATLQQVFEQDWSGARVYSTRT